MYPHLADFLKNMREVYEDVVYIGDSDQGESLAFIDHTWRDITRLFQPKEIRDFFKRYQHTQGIKDNHSVNMPIYLTVRISQLPFNLVIGIYRYLKMRHDVSTQICKRWFKYPDRKLVIAIDYVSYDIAYWYFPYETIFWSHDILTKDASNRIKGGLLERLATSKKIRKAKALIIQDENREDLFLKSLNH